MPRQRSTVYNKITSADKLANVNKLNLDLAQDFLEYLSSVDRSKGTIAKYKSNLDIFWCWNYDHNQNKFFVDLTKREIAKFQNYALNVWQWSPKRIRVVKATLSSLGNYVENVLDDEYRDYKSIVHKIESPADDVVRKKTIFVLNDLQDLLDKLVEQKEYMKACIISLAMCSGKRKAELTRFKTSYFDSENLICDGALYKTPEKMQTKGRGQHGKLLDVYVLARPFKPYLDLWLKQRQKLDITSDWLFPRFVNNQWIDEHIGTVTMDSIARHISRIMEKPFYFHALRHYYTTYLLEQNLPESIVQTIQGWASSDMLRVYDDRSSDSQLEKYFGADGIKNVSQASLEDLE